MIDCNSYQTKVLYISKFVRGMKLNFGVMNELEVVIELDFFEIVWKYLSNQRKF